MELDDRMSFPSMAVTGDVKSVISAIKKFSARA